MENGVFEVCFPSRLMLTKSVVCDALLFVEERVPRFSDIIKNDVKLIFQELLVNAIVHGNENDENKMVCMRVAVSGDTINAMISDEGSGFDYTGLLSGFNRIEELIFDHGRGIRLVYSLVDSLTYNAIGNEVSFLKKITGDN